MQLNRIAATVIFCTMLFSYNIASAQISEDAAIKYVQKVSVAKLDSTLTGTPFADWLRRIIGKKATAEWELNDCGEQTGNPNVDKDRDIPACVGVNANLADGRKINLTIIIGTDKKGIFGSPAIYDISIESKKGFHSVKRLADLEKIIQRKIRE